MFWNFETPTILVAEDEESTQYVVERAFCLFCSKCEPRFVEDGEEAVSYLQGEGRFADRSAFPLPSILLLDLRMPRMGGFELLEWIRLKRNIRELVVVIFSSSDEQEDLDLAFSLGANSYLVKSTLYEDLVEVIKSLEHYWTKTIASPVPVKSSFGRLLRVVSWGENPMSTVYRG